MDLSVKMTELLARLYATSETGDAVAWTDALAPEVVMIGTDAAEWWSGRDVLVPAMTAQAAEMHGAGIRLTGSDPEIGWNKDTVWAADRPTLELPDGSQVALRLTMVCTLEGDSLLIRQGHLSVGAPNEEVVQQTLTV